MNLDFPVVRLVNGLGEGGRRESAQGGANLAAGNPRRLQPRHLLLQPRSLIGKPWISSFCLTTCMQKLELAKLKK